MTINPDIQAERERIKALITRKIEAITEWRGKWSSLKIKKRDLIRVFNRLHDELILLIDNPNYKPKPKGSEPKPKTPELTQIKSGKRPHMAIEGLIDSSYNP